MKSKLFLIFIILCFLGGCSCARRPTFTKENLVSGIHQMLLNEFGLETLIKQNGQSLGVCFSVPRLITTGGKPAPVIIDMLQNIMLCLRRALLSTDVDIQFFQITIRGKDSDHEIVLIRYLRDLKIVAMLGISMEDFQKRMLYRNYVNMASLGPKRLRLFFQDLGQAGPKEIIQDHFVSQISKNDLSPEFITILWESTMKINVKNEILDIRMVSIAEDRALFYCKIREHFKRKEGFKDYSFQSNLGTEEYLFELKAVDTFRAKISWIFLLSSKKLEKEKAYQELVQKYGQPQTWPKEDYYLEDMNLKNFLAEQIAGRVQVLLADAETTKDDKKKNLLFSRLPLVKGYFEKNVFKILFIYSDFKKEVDKKDADTALETAKNVFKSYKFQDCKSIEISTLYGKASSYAMP